MSPVLSLLLALAPAAEACPTIAKGTPNELTYDVAKTAIVRQGTRTTFTVSINPAGTPQDFALVMPVPAVLEEDDIRVLDGSVFASLEGQTGILRMADAGCTPAYSGGYDDGDPCTDRATMAAEDGGDGGDGGGADDYGNVQIEGEYLIGGYELTVISADESDGLWRWLDDNGYQLAEPTVPVLQDYIDEGMVFLAAKVSAEATVADGSTLPPLQVSYDSELFAIPIRLAARNSPGEQDMLIYAVTDMGQGAVGISNYEEFAVEDKCIWGEHSDTFLDDYEARFRPAWQAAGHAGWTVEWAGSPGSCSPCSGITVEPHELEELGYTGDYNSHFLTRLHVRYTPETAQQDLVLYETGLTEPKTTSFADDNELNRECITACDPADREVEPVLYQGWLREDECAQNDADDDDDESKGGCSTAGAGAGSLGLALVALLGLVRRED
jgi:hypothetical protein